MHHFMLKIRVGITTHCGWGRGKAPFIGGHAADEVGVQRERASIGEAGEEFIMHGRDCLGHGAAPQVPLVRKLGAVAKDIRREEVGHFVGCAGFEQLELSLGVL